MTARKRTTRWHAVIVQVRSTSCPAAALCREQRYLSGDAPTLPLPQCDRRANCPCTYKHFDDRRGGPRRTDEINEGFRPQPRDKNRRTSRGRRSRDHA